MSCCSTVVLKRAHFIQENDFFWGGGGVGGSFSFSLYIHIYRYKYIKPAMADSAQRKEQINII